MNGPFTFANKPIADTRHFENVPTMHSVDAYARKFVIIKSFVYFRHTYLNLKTLISGDFKYESGGRDMHVGTGVRGGAIALPPKENSEVVSNII